MNRRGAWIRACAAAVFDAGTMERVVDPAIADLQHEPLSVSRYFSVLKVVVLCLPRASIAGPPRARSLDVWRRRWVRLIGYVALAKVTTQSVREFLVLTFAMTLLLQWPALARWWAFASMSLSLTVLMTALCRRMRRRSLLLAAAPIFFGYYMLVFLWRLYGMPGGGPQVAVGAWIPNAIAVLVAAAIATFGTRRSVTQ